MTLPTIQSGQAQDPEPDFADLLRAVDKDRTPGFRLLRDPSPPLGKRGAELAFVVERPRSSYRFHIWTRAGCRSGDEAVSLETWQSVYKPRSKPVAVPAWLEEHVRRAWSGGTGTDAEIQVALEAGTRRLCDKASRTRSSKRPAEGGEGRRRG
jgi:hypothetical protein